jgi:WD40 repeat protein
MHDAFLSYARSDDEPFVRQLYGDLTRDGFKVWFDRVSMPSRALTFLQEIRDAVENADRLLAVIGPAAIKSAYVLSEWQHALLFAKGVVPLLRLGDFDLLPEDLARLHCMDCRSSRPYDQALAEVVRLLKDPIPPLGPLLTLVPSLPPHFQPRRADLERLSELVLADVQRPTVITSPRQVSALQGMGGIGKSVQAAAFARATTTRRACTDGIIWVTLGPQPDLVELMSLVGTAWGEAPHHFASLETAQARLPRVLEGKVCLLVLDDVWRLGHATPFVNALGPRCRLLITTRDAALGRALGAQEHRLELLSSESARQLLADWLSVPAEALPPAAAQVARRCGYLPLALALCGALARDGVPWRDLLEALEEADLAFLERELKDYPYPDVYRALMVSVDYLARENPVGAQHYRELAVFPPTEGVPQDPVLRLWRHTNGVTDREARKLLATLAQKALLLLAREAKLCRVSLHDLQYAFLKASAQEKEGGLTGLHQCLLAAYGKECGEDWANGPDDAYYFQHLAYHLSQAGRLDALRRLLMDFTWLRARLAATDIQGLIKDYDFLGEDSEISLVQGALRLSANALAQDREQLTGQLTGRLLGFDSPGIQGLLAQIREAQTRVWIRPLTPSLTPPGGPLLRTIITGHTRNITAVALGLDGRLAVSASEDKTLKVWDLDTGIELHTLTGHTRNVTAVALSLDGRFAISASADKTLKVWDLETGEELRTLIGHTDRVMAVVVSLDGRFAVSASADKTLKVWDLETGVDIRSLAGHTRGVTAVAVSPDGRRTASGSWDKSLMVWDLETGDELRTLTGHTNWIVAVALGLDGRLAVSASEDKTLKVWDLDTGIELHTLTGHTRNVTAVALSLDGRFAISASADKTLKVWDLETGNELCTLTGHTDRVTAVAVSPDGRRAVSGSWDETLKVWNLESNEYFRTLTGHTNSVGAVAVSPYGRMAVSGSYDNTLKVWDFENGAELRSLTGHTGGVVALAVSPDGRMAVSGSRDGTLKIWDIETGDDLRTFTGHIASVLSVAVSPDGRRAVSTSQDKTLKVWDLENGKELHSLTGHTDWVAAMAVNPDGRFVVSGSRDGTLKVWNLETGTELHTLTGHITSVWALAVSPDGRMAVSGSRDGTLKVWDLETGTELHSLSGHTDRVTAVTVSPDGWMAVSGSRFGTLKVWDLENKTELRTIGGQSALVEAVAVSPDGRRVLSWSRDKTVKVWDMDTGAEQTTFQAEAPVVAGAMAPDGVTLLAGDTSGRVHILRMEGVTPGPPYVTAWRWQGSLTLGCPGCRQWSGIPETALGTEFPCPACGQPLKLNAFTINADWRPVSLAWGQHIPGN